MEAKLELDPNSALNFILAGKSIFTIRSLKTGARYTYKVSQKQTEGRPPVWFVKLLAGPDNTSDYVYIGMVNNEKQFRLTSKSTMKEDSLPVKAFDWFVSLLARSVTPQNVELWHVGRCGRCGRLLTVPESVALGLGPECAGRI